MDGDLKAIEQRLTQMRFDVDALRLQVDDVVSGIPNRSAANDWPEPRPSFTGTAYIDNGSKTTGLDSDATKDWVKLVVATKTFTQESGPAPNPFPAGEHWWEKNNTFGDIHYYSADTPGIIVMWSGDKTDIPDGWALCDGTANSVGNGGSGRNLSGRFIVGFGRTGTANTQNYVVGDTGGYQHHGNGGGTVGNVNNHTDHDLDHYHLYSPDDPPTQNAAAGADVWAWGADPTNASATCWGQTNNATWNGAGNIPGTDGLIVHSMTDNRPPFYALCFIEKLQ